MEHRIQPARGDERGLLDVCMQPQFQHTVGGIAHQPDAPVWEPSMDEADHLMCPHRDGLVPLAQSFAHFRRRRGHTEERQRPSMVRPGQVDDDCHHNPAQARAAYRALFARKRTVSVMTSFAVLAAPAPFQRFVDDQVHTGPGWHKRLNDQQEQLPAH